MNRSEFINVALSVFLILGIGGSIGYGIGYFHASQKAFPEIRIVGETNPGVATIKFMKVENGLIKGKVSGQKARLAWNSEAILDLPPESDFSIPLKDIRLSEYYGASQLPPGVLFIASINGKYYYSVLDKRALNLSEKNRVYFGSAEEAEKRGYLKAH